MDGFAHIEPEARVETTPSAPMLWHDYANLFPLLEGEAFSSLVEDIRANGVREPVVMFEGKVLDGRNRYLAARECGQAYPVTEYAGPDPLAYVISLNLKRRHLNESQRAMVAAKIAKLPKGANQHPPIGGTSAPTAANAAALLNVGERSVERAREVHQSGAPALVAQVEAGAVSVSAAAEVAKLPEPVQAEVVAEGPEAVREVAADLRKVETANLSEEEVSELREAVAEAAIRGLRGGGAPRPSRKNPDYEPNPAFDAMARVTGCCRTLSETIAEHGPAHIIGGFLDAAMKARNVETMRAAHLALGQLLEASDAA